jgi:pyruvyl transferase EpsO
VTDAGIRGDQDLLASLARTIDEVLDPLVPREGAVALVDFPRTPNVGDSLIWLGTIAWLARSGRGAPRYACSDVTYDPRTMARRLGQGTILLSGGGNFGDLYEAHQRLRERVIADFPDRRIVQLPQSIHFGSAQATARARAILNRHSQLTLLVRDHSSLEFAGNEFSAASRLCPDMAMSLGPLPRHPATQPVVWLSRADKEASAGAHAEAPAGIARVDWMTDGRNRSIRLHHRASRWLRHRPALRPWLSRWLEVRFESIARLRLERGERILSAGEVVVTDRLHAHILCLLLGIPHYLIDNSYGKVRGFHQAWTRESRLTRFCESHAEALRLASSGGWRPAAD